MDTKRWSTRAFGFQINEAKTVAAFLRAAFDDGTLTLDDFRSVGA